MKIGTAKILRAYPLTLTFILLFALAVIGIMTARNNSDYMSTGVSVPTVVLQKTEDGFVLSNEQKVFVRLGGITR